MPSLREIDRRLVLSRIPSELRDIVRARRLYIAGGVVRSVIANEPVKDVDIFGPDFITQADAAAAYAKAVGGYVVPTGRALTVVAPNRVPVQFVQMFCASQAGVVMERFDFTICRAVIWYAETTSTVASSLVDETFYEDLAARRLVYTEPPDAEPGATVLRVLKFVARGYVCPATEWPALIAACVRKAGGPELDELWRTSMLAHLRLVDPALSTEADPIAEPPLDFGEQETKA
jgi:hypothetical protein